MFPSAMVLTLHIARKAHHEGTRVHVQCDVVCSHGAVTDGLALAPTERSGRVLRGHHLLHNIGVTCGHHVSAEQMIRFPR